ncbi:GH1 family beta-glucosidase [Ruania rhizosphaerae]|uniref:GH1 family beta-glucosidase n=1 Tax=Ruania rhizosphaerae TaxID=1840413 RepID=UPI0013591FE8|nr:GH1 family beta-glucosidase [Ruania rhizosphaerae]
MRRPDGVPAEISHRPFPPGFVIGAATAAYQIEGAVAEDGRTPSIWDTFSRVPGAVAGGDTGDVACEHYHRYREDVAIMREIGLHAYRFSVSWSRVCPDGGPVNTVGLDFYSRLVDELLSHGIMPWLTLHHWDMPQALEERGGWTSRTVVDRFVEYATTVHDALGDRVSHWTTHNEPWCSAFLGYVGGQHAPGRREPAAGIAAGHHLLLAHGASVTELRRRDPSLSLGITLNLQPIEPVDATSPGDLEAARRIDGQFNRFFLDPLLRGHYPDDVLEDLRPFGLEDLIAPGDLESISAPIDVLGVNYYHGDAVSYRPPIEPLDRRAPTTRPTGTPYPSAEGVHVHSRGLPRTAMNWEIQPEGLTTLLLRLHEDYLDGSSTRLWVTENGAAFHDIHDVHHDSVHDPERAAFVQAHLGAVLDAVDLGVDVGGYFAWSLLDNFEWAWGYGQRFGLVHVDYATQRRTVKTSGATLRDIIHAQALITGGPTGERP